MGREIERKFLLRDDAWRAGIERSVHMAQGYLGEVSRASVRVRIADRDATINIKSAHPGISRDEFEYTIPLADAEALLTLCSGWPVIKTRHIVRVGAHTWEIDEFAGANAGLIVAEIELDAPDEEFERPPWLGEEVSEDWRYYNVALARQPFSEWGR